MKFRIHYSNHDWLPKEGGGIKLWREDVEWRHMWPCGEPSILSA
jgi:hypothetical protein